MPNDTKIDMNQDPTQILKQLVQTNLLTLGPYQKGVRKRLEELGTAHVDEAITSGVDPRDIQKEAGLDHKQVLSKLVGQGENKKKGNFLHTPFQIDEKTGQVTSESILGGLISATPQDTLARTQAQVLGQKQPQNSPEQIASTIAEAQKLAPEGYDAVMSSDQQIYYKPKSDSNNDLIMGMKEDQFKQQRLQKMGDDLDPSKNVRNPYGVAQLGLNRAERIEGLVNQYKDLNLDTREMEELAIGLNSMLQGSNISAQQQVRSLVPKSAIGNVQKMKEWLQNEPQGLNQQKFVQRMLNDVEREKKVFQGQVYKFARAKISKYSDLRKKYPDEFNDISKSFGIDPEVYDKWKEGGFKNEPPIDAMGGTNTNQSWDNSKESRYQELLRKRGGK